MTFKYDFTSIMDRHGKDSIAVDNAPGGETKEGFDRIPMWVADMNFPTCPTITEAIAKRIQHPAYGYFLPTEEYYNSIIQWQSRRNGVTGLQQKHIGYENGVLGGVVSAINVYCSKGDNILIHTPTYIGFTHALGGNGYHLVGSPLVKDEQGIWRMDYEDMEKKIVENHIHAAVICNPHNPCGRVWTKEELQKAMELFEKHDVYVVSDEIWSDLMLNGHKHTPTQSVNAWAHDRVAAFYAPSKTFNLAGLVGSYHIIYSDWIRERVEKESSTTHYNSMNVLSMHALIGTYQEAGYEWVDELTQVLSDNVNYACDYITEHFKGVTLSKPEGTYMLFLDCTDWCKEHQMSMDELEKKGVEVGVIWQDGRPFHGEYGIRMNLAVPHARVVEAFSRLDQYVFNAK
ncbi:MAG: aminotransferase class I/II-fold pyridoxal phosphate-dependent enzyme [Solobacterium sp.]|jgi:cystathionine beta-lyase|nr:aminotransferase class I/II-fold pyridoxal phosphate-dependent enzyme [Solobacterium sp.]MCH4222539.1 aminotransferase class I/II-fold pyridoxal phosphate-dependent enzyme [Solobacterium sp.]MCH4265471.1 aminotransferase class I/II-fold pyridoxal phosphate-dependent enzyme [Solobacterium sp.]